MRQFIFCLERFDYQTQREKNKCKMLRGSGCVLKEFYITAEDELEVILQQTTVDATA